MLTVSGGTGAIVEYHRPGRRHDHATGKATICNMGAEIGATCSVFAYDDNMAAYLKATGREAIADAADDGGRATCVPTRGRATPAFYDRVIEIDLDELLPLINGPDTPDLAHAVSEVGAWARDHGVPVEISLGAHRLVHELVVRGHHPRRLDRPPGRGQGPARPRRSCSSRPGSEQVRATIERDGLLADLEAIGGEVLANACGPCIGQWERTDLDPSKVNTIVNSYNRNFPKRNDGNANTKAFVTSPDTVIAYALAGTLDFNPLTDTLTNDDGEAVRLDPPVGEILPARRASTPARTRSSPRRPTAAASPVVVDPTSDRLQLLEPFPAWDGQDYHRPAGADEGPGQVHHRPHLGRRQVAEVPRPPREHLGQPLPRRGQRVHRRHRRGQGPSPTARPARSPTSPSATARPASPGAPSATQNYGEGSSREHAAMEPRFRNGRVIFARSFARIHETNLKKQGLLPLTFADPATYDQIGEDDRISVLGLADLAPGRSRCTCQIRKPDGTSDRLRVHPDVQRPSRSSGSTPARP